MRTRKQGKLAESIINLTVLNNPRLQEYSLERIYERMCILPIKETIAGQLRLKREEFGISTRYYQSIEAADKKPSLNIIFELAFALDCDYAELLQPSWDYWLEHVKNNIDG